ncbi:MAG: pyruvate dehydrogenase [Planctomycetota bacterium]
MPRSSRSQVALGGIVSGEAVQAVIRRVLAQATHMIFEANHRDDVQPGDPKVGGHPAASSSSLHLLAALHLFVRQSQDWIASKPHASPTDHALHHLMGLLRDPASGEWLTEADSKRVMSRLRSFSKEGEPVFQSYHAASDPDAFGQLPSGSVGLPAVAAMYQALAFRYLEDRGLREPDGAHFWCLVGDSELREGSLLEALPEAAERQLGNVTWILDYNRQSLDGARVPGEVGLRGTDSARICDTVLANGWKVFEVRHGSRRRAAFLEPGGEVLERIFDKELGDFELQTLLAKGDGGLTRRHLIEKDASVRSVLSSRTDDEVQELLADLGGHDIEVLAEALRESKTDPDRPTFIIAHTLKGWGLASAAQPGNHSSLPSEEEVAELLSRSGLAQDDPYAHFEVGSAEGAWLERRGAELRSGIEACASARERVADRWTGELSRDLPATFGVDLRMVPTVHTQWMWGQIIAKLIRLGGEPGAAKNDLEESWSAAAPLVMTLSPDVGTTTQIAFAMDGKVYGPPPPVDYPARFEARDPKRPDLTPTRSAQARHIRMEIVESNAVLAMGAFGKLRDTTGVPLLPALTIYDFFIKRALDQLYYDLYWGASFLLIGTPSGVTLAPEGAQHSWKSDFQLPNLITWEPAFAIEMDWILADACRRHFQRDDAGRSGVLVRGVTRALPQKLLMERVRQQVRFSEVGSDEEILEALRADVLAGGYWLIDHRGAEGYEPGENVVTILVMGALVPEAVEASDRLLERGIHANVLVVTSADLLLGRLARPGSYEHLKQLGLNGDLHLRPGGRVEGSEAIVAAGRRIPIVSVCDGEPGLLDNAGSILGVKQIALGLEKPSKCGRPSDVYRYHGLNADSIHEACGQVLAETALEEIVIDRAALERILARSEGKRGDWKELWG